jgi:hypothetical protein
VPDTTATRLLAPFKHLPRQHTLSPISCKTNAYAYKPKIYNSPTSPAEIQIEIKENDENK